MTFSLIARCEKTNMFGTVISSSSISVASRCPWVRAGTGAAATQNVTDPSLGNLMLDYLEQGMSPQDVINKIKNEKTNIDYRQLLLIDSSGKTFSYSGNKILGTHGVAEGTNCIAAGNMLKSKDIPSAMVDSFKNNSNLFFPERLMLSLKAGLTAGGEEGSIHSAGIKVVDDTAWPLIDLRIDWSDNDPIEELYKLWKAYEPQMNDYKSRALDPTKAPSYGVPGDL
tara:strand:- start:832 stop:1509 length:678 start_codon:yes stop_codon:yes gene_type:complete